MKATINFISASYNNTHIRAYPVTQNMHLVRVDRGNKFGQNIVLNTRNQSIKNYQNKVIIAELLEVLISDSGGTELNNSLMFQFNSNDLINGSFTAFHGWNTTAIDVTVIDNLGREIELPTQVNLFQVIVDASRATIANGVNWTVLIEK